MMDKTQVNQNKRPKWVWVISIFYIISVIYTFLSFYLIKSGTVHVPEATKVYLHSLTAVDYTFSVLIGLLNLAGAVSLFLLRKAAYYIFLLSFIANILISVIHIISKNMLAAFAHGEAIGMFIGWGMLLAVCLYARRLTQKGLLR